MSHHIMNSSKHYQVSTRNDEYSEEMQFPTSANTRQHSNPKIQFLMQDISENQANKADTEGNLQEANLGEKLQSKGHHAQSTHHKFRTQYDNNSFSHVPQSKKQHEKNIVNQNFTLPGEVMNADTLYCTLSDVNSSIIQSQYSALCPLLNLNIISIPFAYIHISQNPHHHYILSQPFPLGLLPNPQMIPCINCQPRIVHCLNSCKSCELQRVFPVETKEGIVTESSPKNIRRRQNSKNENCAKILRSASEHQKQNTKLNQNIIDKADSEMPYFSSMTNSLTTESKPHEESRNSNSQYFQDWKKSYESIKEHQSLRKNAVEKCVDSLENSIEKFPNVRYVNHCFPDTDFRFNENQSISKERIKCDEIGWKRNQKGKSNSRTSDFRKEDNLFQCSLTNKFSKNKHQRMPEKNDSQALNIRKRVSQKNDSTENLTISNINKCNARKDELNSSQKGEINDNGKDKNSELKREKFTKSNFNAKLLAKRPIIFQNGIQEMNIMINHDDIYGKEDSGCEYHATCKQVKKVSCPSIKLKENKYRELKDYQLDPEVANQIKESISSYPVVELKKTKAIINFVLQQLQEKGEKYNGEENTAQNCHTDNQCNNHIDSQYKHYKKTTKDERQRINDDDTQISQVSSISQRNPVSPEDEASIQPSTSTTLSYAQFVHSDVKLSLKDFGSESGIDTD